MKDNILPIAKPLRVHWTTPCLLPTWHLRRMASPSVTVWFLGTSMKYCALWWYSACINSEKRAIMDKIYEFYGLSFKKFVTHINIDSQLIFDWQWHWWCKNHFDKSNSFNDMLLSMFSLIFSTIFWDTNTKRLWF